MMAMAKYLKYDNKLPTKYYGSLTKTVREGYVALATVSIAVRLNRVYMNYFFKKRTNNLYVINN